MSVCRSHSQPYDLAIGRRMGGRGQDKIATVTKRRHEQPDSSIGTAIADESGQGLVEYGLILLLVAVAAIAALRLLGLDLSSYISFINTAF